jgi:RNA polymerase sigma-70 factor (ECF subfamily)
VGSLGTTVAARPSAEADDDRMRGLCATYAGPLLGYLMRLTRGDRQAAEDLVQETFARTWRSLDQLVTDDAMLRSWLFTVARRVAIDSLRARRARPAEFGLIDLGGYPSASDDIDRMLTSQLVRKALEALSDDHKRVIIEVYFEGKTAAEAAAALRVPVGTIKSRTYYALRDLRSRLESSRSVLVTS